MLLSEMHSAKMGERMFELSEWLLPLKTVSVFDESSLSALVSCLKQYNDEITDLPKGLVTVMRILYSLAIAPPRDDGTYKLITPLSLYCNVLWME